jgi:NAD(P)H-flavin reductase
MNVNVLFIALQIIVFIAYWYLFPQNHNFHCACKKFQQYFPLAKACASLATLNLAIVILFSVHLVKKFIYLPVSLKSIHYTAALFTVVWSIVHSVASYINFSKLRQAKQLYTSWGTGFTGIVLLLVLGFIGIISFTRKHFYHKFIFFHFILASTLLVFLYIHQSFCFYKTDNNVCPLPVSAFILLIPVLFYLSDFISRYCVNNYVKIEKVIIHAKDLIEFQLFLPQCYAGKTIRLNCPDISLFEWHPFTTAIYDDSTITTSVFVKLRGNWTLKLARYFGYYYDTKSNCLSNIPTIFPQLRLTGPYYVYPKRFLDDISNTPTIIVATGIGITSFSYLLTQIQQPLTSHLHLVISTKHPNDIRWLFNVLSHLQQDLHFSLAVYFTDTNLTTTQEVPFTYQLGRPDFSNLLQTSLILNNFSKHPRVHVYHSGVLCVSQIISNICSNSSVFDFKHID